MTGPPTPVNGYNDIIFTRPSGLCTMAISVFGYPEPVVYKWYKKTSSEWRRLYPLSNLLFGMDGFHANLTIVNVIDTDYGDYAVKAYNGQDDDNIFTKTFTLYKEGTSYCTRRTHCTFLSETCYTYKN